MLTAARAQIDQIVRGTDSLFLVLDDQQGVAFVAQVMHHTHQLADIARVQSNARFVHHEKRVCQRRAEACGEIYALHFAAAQRARGSVEREVTDAYLAEVIEAGANFVTQHFSCFIVRRQFDRAQSIASVGNREPLELRKRKL